MKVRLNKKIDIKFVILAAFTMFAIVILVLQPIVNAANTFPGIAELVSVNNVNGGGLDTDGLVSAVSEDGNKILFTTTATNLPDSTGSAGWRTYLRDMTTGSMTRVDVSSSGVVPDRIASNFVMSNTGRYVAFSSASSNLIDGTTLSNTITRVYVKDLQTNIIKLITNISSNDTVPYSNNLKPKSISDDGRYITIQTQEINKILPGSRTGSDYYADALLYDSQKDSWTILNKGVDGLLQGTSTSVGAASCDGSIIMLESAATNLTTNFSGSGKHVFIADIRNGLTVTDITDGANANSNASKISCNGRYITYATLDRTIITPTPTGMTAIYEPVRFDRITGERMYIRPASNNTGFGAMVNSITNKGDLVLVWTTVNFKHYSDGSGTLERVQHSPAIQLYWGTSQKVTALSSADGRYVVVSSADGNSLGLPVGSGSGIYDIIRFKTGL